MRGLLVLFGAFAFAACDSSPAPADASQPGFSAVVSGGLDRSIAGAASTSDLGGVGVSVGIDEADGAITVLRLAADGSEDVFSLIGVTEAALSPGTYTVRGLGNDPESAGFLAVYQYRTDTEERPGRTFAIGDEGTVTIERADDEAIAGSFAFVAQTPRLSRQPDGTVLASRDTIDVEGTFVAEVREIDRSPASR